MYKQILDDLKHHSHHRIFEFSMNENLLGIKLIERLKTIFEPNLGITFQSKETVIDLSGCLIEVLVGAIGLSVSKQTR